MSSLFQDGGCGCGGNQKHEAGRTKCKNCICDVLMQLSDRDMGDICSMGAPRQRLLIKQKGTSTPVALDGSTVPTEFTLVKVDPENCCAVFSFEDVNGATRTFVEDCRSIAGIVCIPNNGGAAAV